MASPKSNSILLIVSGISILVTALLSAHIVPLYDGVGFPDEPYRYAGRPLPQPDGAKLPPTTAGREVKWQDIQYQVQYVSSTETGPQVSITLEDGAATLPDDDTEFYIEAVPVAPVAPLPTAPVDGNVYRVTASADGGSPVFHSDHSWITLRYPTDIPLRGTPTLYFRSGTTLRQLTTTKVGNDIYQAPLQGVGDYLLVTLPHNAWGGVNLPVEVGLIAFLLVVVVVVVMLLRRQLGDETTG